MQAAPEEEYGSIGQKHLKQPWKRLIEIDLRGVVCSAIMLLIFTEGENAIHIIFDITMQFEKISFILRNSFLCQSHSSAPDSFLKTSSRIFEHLFEDAIEIGCYHRTACEARQVAHRAF